MMTARDVRTHFPLPSIPKPNCPQEPWEAQEEAHVELETGVGSGQIIRFVSCSELVARAGAGWS